MKLSIIVPCKNEEGNIYKLNETLQNNLNDIKYEVIYIDDGSTDDTLKILKEIKDKRIKIISFSRNFKKEAAIYAGLNYASGKYTCIIDGDMQQNPRYLLDMIKVLDEEKYDQVAMVIKKRKESRIFRFFKKVFYRIMNKISDVDFVNGASDFRMFNAIVKNAILEMSERNRFSKGLFAWIGFKTKYLYYDVEKRLSGKSKFNYNESFKYAMEGIVGFSVKPLKIATVFGLLSSLSAFIYFIVIIVKTLITGVETPGYASILCVILLLGGIQLITIGILGEYMAKTYLEAKKRPIYLIKEKIGFDDSLL